MGNEKIRIEHILSSDRTGDGDRLVTANTGDSLTQSVPLLYDADGSVISTATRTGNTTNYATATAGGKTTNYVAVWDANDNLDEVDPSTFGSTPPSGTDAGVLAYTAPPSSGWSWDNQDSATVDFSNDEMNMVADANSAVNNLNVQYRTAPSTPWTVTVVFQQFMGVGSALQNSGTGWRDSSGKIITVRLFKNTDSGIYLNVAKHNSSTSADTNYYFQLINYLTGRYVIRIGDNGTNLTVEHGIDYTNLVTAFTVSRTDWFSSGPNAYIAMVDSGGTTSGTNYSHLKILSLVEA